MARRKKGRTVKVNMKGVETRRKVAPGMYPGRVKEVTSEESDNGPYLSWVFEITGGKFKGAPGYYNTSLQQQALWNLRGILEALGEEVPDSTMDIDLDELEGNEEKVCLVFERDDSYKVGQVKLTEVLNIDNLEEGEDDDDEGEEEEDEKEDKPDAADVKKMDEDELEEVIDDHDLDVDLDDHKGIRKKRQAVIDALEDEGEEDEGEEEEEDDDDDGDEAYTSEEVNKMKSGELEKLVEKHDLDVELDGTLRKRRRTVLKALEDEDLIEDDDD